MYEQMTRHGAGQIPDASWLKRMFFKCGHVGRLPLRGPEILEKGIPFHWRLLHGFAMATVQKKLRTTLGMSRVRNAYTGGAAMGPDHFRFFHSWGST